MSWRIGSLVSYDARDGVQVHYVYRLPEGDERETADNRIRIKSQHNDSDPIADALLIAAAPELLTALNRLCRFVDDDTCRHDTEKAAALAKARKAIAKARGEKP